MSHIDLPVRYKAFHAAGGAFLYSALGAAWALVGALELRPVGSPWVNIILGVVTGLLLIASVRALQRADELPEEEMSPEQREERARRAWRSRRVLSIEGMFITGVSVILFLLNRHAYVAPATSFLVGLHFIALAAVHRTPGEYAMGGAIAALSVATMIWVPDMPSIHNMAMNIYAGLGTGVILWIGSIVRLAREEQIWAQASERQNLRRG